MMKGRKLSFEVDFEQRTITMKVTVPSDEYLSADDIEELFERELEREYGPGNGIIIEVEAEADDESAVSDKGWFSEFGVMIGVICASLICVLLIALWWSQRSRKHKIDDHKDIALVETQIVHSVDVHAKNADGDDGDDKDSEDLFNGNQQNNDIDESEELFMDGHDMKDDAATKRTVDETDRETEGVNEDHTSPTNDTNGAV